MQPFDELCRWGREVRRRRVMRHSGLGMAVLLLAGLLVPAPGNVAIAAIAAVGLVVMGAQHVILRRLIARSAELIPTREALLAGAVTSPLRPEAPFALAGVETTYGGRNGRNGEVLTRRGGGAPTRGRRLAA